jgi:CRISPR-associated protein (TIGR02584 family)
MATQPSQTKYLLLSVTGMSPAVVTETLYGIAQRIKDGESGAHWPDEIRIITTSDGKREMVSRLVDGDWLRQVCEAVDMPMINMPDEHILIVPDADGKPVDDARSEDDHEALANFITRTVRDLTSDDNLQIHASIAGGRKTMTFYLGYAMSLFGRHFDRMSHVLVSDRKFEVAGFYFPGQEPEKDRVETRTGVIKPSEAEVILSDIPFIRMRHNLPTVMTDKASVTADLNYRKLVDLINLGDRPDDICLKVYPRSRQVSISDQNNEVARVTLSSPVFMALYAVFAEEAADKDGEVFTSKKLANSGHRLLGYFSTQLANVVELDTTGMTSADILPAVLELDYVTDEFPNLGRSVESIIKNGVQGSKLGNLVSAVAEQMKPTVPANLLRYVLPVAEFNKDKKWLGDLSEDEKGGHKHYGIRLKPHQVYVEQYED